MMSVFFSLSPHSAALTFTDRTQKIWDWFSGSPLHILEIIFVALIAQRLGSRAITRAMNRLASVDLSHRLAATANRQKERARTTGTVLRSTLNAVIWVIALGMILGEFGLNLGPLIASAGVIGIAFGLGAQTIVRDVLAGLFMLIEDQYGVGDRIDVLEITGVVERVGLRITTVRDEAGTLWYLRNGEILKVGNQSQSG
ncbi:MAG: mechanosensitive ion channel [Candidatus Nanopelagicaceae bacterium]|nr:mechanosensitive ion channel [Candidatus Nanopelagicaceae bacterium]